MLRISIHALLAESDSSPNTDIIILDISIHALLAESDIAGVSKRKGGLISIHALLAESDTPRLSRVVPTPIFLSTLSLRRATEMPMYGTGDYERFLSTLSLRRATHH